MDSSEFAGQIIQKSTQLAQELRDKIYVFEKKLEGPELIPVLQSWMWKEYWLGVPPPAKQITLLPDQDVNIKLRLTRQILEEYKHYQVFSRRVKELGGNGDLRTYQPSDQDMHLYHVTYDFDDPIEIAASLQCSGEVLVGYALVALAERVDEQTGELIRQEVIPEEASHIANGRLILETYATTSEQQQRVEAIIDRKFKALYSAHGEVISEALREKIS